MDIEPSPPNKEDFNDLKKSALDGFHGIDNKIKTNMYSTEYGKDVKNHAIFDTLFITMKWLYLGSLTVLSSDKLISFGADILSNYDPEKGVSSFSAMYQTVSDHALPALFYSSLLAASLITTSIYSKNKEKMINEHQSLESFKNELLDIVQINKNEKIKDDLTSNKLHKLYLIGNEMHGESRNETIHKIKKTISALKELWNDKELNFFNSLKKILTKQMKLAINNKIEIDSENFNNHKQIENLKHLKSLWLADDKLNDPDIRGPIIKKFNKQAIDLATRTYSNQNLQILFGRIVQDILKSDEKGLRPIHLKILMKFEDLHRVTKVTNFFTGEVEAPIDMKNISKIAHELINGTSSLNKKSNLVEIMETINNNMVRDGKIKYGSFEKHIKIAKNKLTKKEDEIKDIARLSIVYDTLINPDDLEKIVSIDLKKAEKKIKATKMSSVDKKNKLDEIR